MGRGAQEPRDGVEEGGEPRACQRSLCGAALLAWRLPEGLLCPGPATQSVLWSWAAGTGPP